MILLTCLTKSKSRYRTQFATDSRTGAHGNRRRRSRTLPERASPHQRLRTYPARSSGRARADARLHRVAEQRSAESVTRGARGVRAFSTGGHSPVYRREWPHRALVDEFAIAPRGLSTRYRPPRRPAARLG